MRLVKALILFTVLAFLGCQQKPTSIIEQSVNIFKPRTVLMDTRTALDYQSFHIEGSVSLLTEDFILLKNPMANKRNQKRSLDPDLKAVVERLALKGISPELKILLIGDKQYSISNRKWKWLLNNLEVSDVQLYSIDQVRKMNRGSFAEPEKQIPWELRTSENFQKEFILNKADQCFVRIYKNSNEWNSAYCN